MVHTLPQNYKRNIEILEENLKRGMSASQAISAINNWRRCFIKHDMLGENEKAFLNECLSLVEPQTHMTITMM